MNAQRFNVYVSVNAIRSGVRARTKNAIGDVRLESCDGIPRPSYPLESSPNRVHIFWRVAGFATKAIEALQKYLAGEFRTDPAATACSQTTRLPGYRNHKHDPSHLVTIKYGDSDGRYAPHDFPNPPGA